MTSAFASPLGRTTVADTWECDTWECIVVAPPHAAADRAGLAEALSAGAVVAMDVGWSDRSTFDELARVVTDLDHQSAGLRIDVEVAPVDPDDLPTGLGVLVVAGEPSQLTRWNRRARRVVAEVTGARAAREAVAAGADGVIVRANEAAGRVSGSGAFLLLQQLRGLDAPFWVAGATGVDAAAAHRLAGARGLVLGEELWGLWPSPPDERLARLVASSDGTETTLVERAPTPLRLSGIHARPDHAQLELADPEDLPALLAGRGLSEPPVPLGQGIAFAGSVASRYGTITAALWAYHEVALDNVAEASRRAVFGTGSRLAADHGTRYPLVQGPMTRVSDVAPFAATIADHGALPFIALSLMSGADALELMAETAAEVRDRPWGVGILGFAPPELRSDQLEAVLSARPDFAVIAGGRPPQARELEEQGIRTYLHVPSPGLLRSFLDEGARRFVFEGRECGGHIGPRSSLTLWQQMLDVMVAADLPDPEHLSILLAGGIHDAHSSAMAQAVIAPAARRGIRIGALMGTAYMFTPEAVAAGAITEDFQHHALSCDSTSLLTTAPGHQTRCATSPYAEEFARRRRDMLAAGRDQKEIWAELEILNTGRLRVASKGLRRSSDVAEASGDGIEGLAEKLRSFDEEVVVEITSRGALVDVDAETRRREGLYMLGEVAMLRDSVQPMAELHEFVSERSLVVLRQAATERRLDAVALVGAAANFPTAPDLRQFWALVVDGRSAVTEVPVERWDPAIFYTEDRQSPNRVYSKWGSFLDPMRFDPLDYRIPPRAAIDASPEQIYALDAAATALARADLTGEPLSRSRTAVLVGAASFGLGIHHFIRPVFEGMGPSTVGEELSAEVLQNLDPHLPQWSEDVFPGMLTNVIAGRIANRLNLHGTNVTVDAACAASLASIEMAVAQLRSGRADAVIAGGIDCTNTIGGFIAFARTHALTPSGISRPFDASADGIVLGEGVGMVAMKRLTDAVRDGNDIDAVLLGVGASSDGQSKSLTAPYPEGQRIAVERAYADAGVSPDTVALVEAHGTGTAAGDRSEIESLGLAFGPDRGRGSISLGSVKSNIGHAKTAAGVAGLTKAALSLRNRILPPTINIERPSPALEGTPFVAHTARRPWVRTPERPVRRAAQSAFGFGGTNFHVVLEEYDHPDPRRFRDLAPRPVELFTWSAATRADLLSRLAELSSALEDLAEVPLAQIARSVAVDDTDGVGGAVRCAIVATDHEDLRAKVDAALDALDSASRETSRQVHIGESERVSPDEIAFLYPGQGAQYLGMFGELASSFPFALPWIEAADAAVDGISPLRISEAVYPSPAHSKEQLRAQRERLDDTRMAQPSIGAMNILAHEILDAFGIRPARVAGHSYGEIAATVIAGFLSPSDGMRFSARRGLAAHEAASQTPGGMASVSGTADDVQALLDELGRENVFVATMNAPENTIIAGVEDELVATIDDLVTRGLATRRVPVTAPFHTPLVSITIEMAQAELADLDCRTLRHPVYSDETAEPMDPSPDAVRETIAHMTCAPVRFVDVVRNMHRDGARVFIEAGPNRILTNLVGRILGDEEHLALNLDDKNRSAFFPFADLLATLYARGLATLDVESWFAWRGLEDLGVAALRARESVHRPVEVVVTPDRVRPVSAGEAPRAHRDGPADTGHADAARPSHETLKKTSSSTDETWERPEAVDAGPVVSSGPPPPDMPVGGARRPVASPQPSQVQDSEVVDVSHESRQPTTWVQDAVLQWIELQKEQTRLLERLLAAQSDGPAAPPAGSVALPGPSTRSEQLAQPVPAQPSGPTVANPWLGQSAGWSAPTAPVPTAPPPVVTAPQPPTSSGDASTAPPPAPAAPSPEPSTGGVVASPNGANGSNGHAPERNGSAVDHGVAVPAAEPASVDVEAGEIPSVEQFTTDLLVEVSARTGYPEDMLDLDLPLEAGLGIDSIKVLEIFGGLRKYHGLLGDAGADDEELLARFVELETLRDIVSAYEERRAELVGAGTAGGGATPLN